MKNFVPFKRLFCLLLFIAMGLAAQSQAQGHVEISQVYGGGGNSGATYRYDFIELYNPTASAVDLSTWSVQYASSTGPTSGTLYTAVPLTGTIGAGQYFLIRGCIGNTGSTNGVDLPTPDFSFTNYTSSSTCSPGISATAGKIALVNNQTPLAIPFGAAPGLTGATCPTINTAAIVDYVGFGTAATCYEGTAPTATLSATLAAIRNGSNADTNNNGADFSAVLPNPRNSATNSGSSSALAVTSATASPASVTSGTATTLTVVVAPGTLTTSTTVTANLSSIGGSATQALTLSSTANTYTYTYTVPSSTAASAYTIPVTATDQTSATANSNISLTVVAPVVLTPISTIQANRSTYVGTTITFNGIITMVTNAGYYLQTASATPGSTGDEGIYVYSGSGRNPATAVVGNNVTVTGTLTLYPLATASHTPSLEVTSASLTVNSTGNTLPTPIAITSLTATGGIYQLTKYESMRVSFSSLTATGPTGSTLTEVTETSTSSGQFYAVLGSTPRPFREPGMDFRDFPATTCPTVTNCTATATAAGVARPSNLTLFDDNPERIIVESSLGGGAALDVSTGATLTAPTGVIDFTYSTDVPYGDPARLILDAGVFTPTSPNFKQGMSVVPVGVPGAGQFTVAAFNIERFFDPISSNDKFYNAATGTVGNSSAVDVTADAYARRLKKISLAIRTVLNNPDIISLEEVENVGVANDIANQIKTDSGGSVTYTAYGTDSSTTYTNDVGGISVGFLVKSTASVTKWEQIGNTSTFAASTGTQTLNDRPSQVLHATISRGTGVKPYPVTVIANHLRSLSGVNNSADTRLKKELQAEMVATAIQGYQANGEHVLAMGDFNAFQFSDGYNDVLGTVTGNPGTNVAAQPGKSGILSKPAIDLITTLPAALQQTYVEYGNAQILDHIVVTQDLASTGLQVAHLDSDFPEVYGNDATTPARVSDHDVPVAYLTLPTPVTSAFITGLGTFATPVVVGQSSAGQQFVLTNTGETTISITGFTVTGDFAQSNNCGSSLAPGIACQVSVVFTPTAVGTRTGTLTLVSSATVAPVTLTGTALAPADFTLTDSFSSNSSVLSTVAGQSGTVSLNLTSTGGFSGSVTLSCAATGTAATGATCTVTSPVTLAAAGTAASTVTLTTTARTQTSGLGILPSTGIGRASYILLAAMLAAALMLVGRNGRKARMGGLLMLLFVLTVGATGCSTSHSITTNPNGTQAGTYTYTVTATSGTLTHTQKITLTVQ